jgi:LGFP repeat
VSDEMDMPGGRMSRFERGEIRWTPTGGPKATVFSGFGDDFVGVPADD